MKGILHIVTFIGTMTILFVIQWYAVRGRSGDAAQTVFVFSFPAKVFAIITASVFPLVVLDIATNTFMRVALFALEGVLVGYVIFLMTASIRLTDDSIETASVFRKQTTSFAEIIRIRKSEMSQSYFLERQRRRPVKISFYVAGVKILIAALESKTDLKSESVGI